MDVNGTPRQVVEPFEPTRYVGVDIVEGPGVDEVVGVGQLVNHFGPESFDVVISTEMLEHVEDWRDAVNNLKAVLAPGGTLVLTTRSPGFMYHGHPWDFWRFSVDDMRGIFDDMAVTVEDDPLEPGVFVAARRGVDFAPRDLSGVRVTSVFTNRRHAETPKRAQQWFYRRRYAMKRLRQRLGL